MERKHSYRLLLRDMYKNRLAYLCLSPFLLVFFVFTLLPVVVAVYYSFTNYNMLKPAEWIGLQNYINMFTTDGIFLTALVNTLIFAVAIGPLGYLSSLFFAWMINELSPKVRAIMVVIFYAPSISGASYLIWSLMFSGDEVGYINGVLLNMHIISAPIQWTTDPDYMKMVVIIVGLWMSMGSGFLSFVAGLQTIDHSMYEAGWLDGVKNRWQELWYITLPTLKPQLLYGAIMSITGAFSISGPIENMLGYPTTDDAATTIMLYLNDCANSRFEMGYASAMTVVLFFIMLLSNKGVQKLLSGVGK